MAGAVLAEAVAAEAVQLAQAILLTALPGRRDHLLCLVKLARSLALSQRLQRAAQLHQQLQLQLPAAVPTPVDKTSVWPNLLNHKSYWSALPAADVLVFI